MSAVGWRVTTGTCPHPLDHRPYKAYREEHEVFWVSEGGRILLVLGNQDPLVEAEGKVRGRNMGFLGEIEERLSIQTHKIFMDVSTEQGETHVSFNSRSIMGL